MGNHRDQKTAIGHYSQEHLFSLNTAIHLTNNNFNIIPRSSVMTILDCMKPQVHNRPSKFTVHPIRSQIKWQSEID